LHWPTHILIADKIDKLINEKLNMTLDSKRLKYGSIKPDITPRLLRLKHLKHRSLNQVEEMIDKIKNSSFPDTKRGILRFSRDLGIILHYITDFFCYAHNHPRFISKIEHIKYEWQVAFRYTKADFEKIIENAWNNAEEYISGDKNSIKDYIDEKHKEYMSNGPSIVNDVNYSLEMCITIAIIIVSNSKAVFLAKAA
jgi:hypothetical protein